MKKILYLLLLPFAMTSCIFWSGTDDDFNPPQSFFNPIIMERAEFEASVALLPPKTIVKSGKIYVKDQFLFIAEVRKGFHVFNYADATNPIPLAFIQIPGATDLAMRDGTIYINQAVDLVTLQYGVESGTVTVTNRNRNIFPQMRDPHGFQSSVSNNQIIVDYEEL